MGNITECGIVAVILDIVFNQSAGLHPWYQMYPISSNPFYNEEAPHAYSVLNDWKQDNALVQQQWKDALKYWMNAYKVDGFRFDLVKGLGNNSSYGGDTEKYNQSRVDNMKALHAAMKEVNPNAYHINEHLAGSQEENAMAADGQMNWANLSNASCQFAMGFQSGADCNRFMSTNDSRTWASTVSYAESHDEERMAYKQSQWGNGALKTDLATRMKQLEAMKEDAIFINCGRGSLIDTDALVRVLQDGHLGGCGLDVVMPEPLPESSPLWDMEHVILTPHISGASFGHVAQMEDRIYALAADNLNRFLSGEPLKNEVDFETGYRRSQA